MKWMPVVSGEIRTAAVVVSAQSVQDSGPGSDPQAAHRFVEPLYRAGIERIETGLSQSRSIIESPIGNARNEGSWRRVFVRDSAN
jgi:hypothetical protein